MGAFLACFVCQHSQPRAYFCVPFWMQVHYYCQTFVDPPPPGALPANVACCGVPAGARAASALGFVGYEEVVSHAEHIFRAAFPDLPWVSDMVLSTPQDDGGEGEDAAASAHAGSEEEVDDAIDDLQAALQAVSMSVAPTSSSQPMAAGEQCPATLVEGGGEKDK